MVKAYYPQTMNDCLAYRKEDSQALIYAGGTDLMVIKEKLNYNSILFLEGVDELKKINEDEKAFYIGPMASYSQLLQYEGLPPMLLTAISEIAAPGIRNSGTLGGNICNASPAGDTLPVLYALEAELKLESQAGERLVPIQDFILGVRKTGLGTNEILSQIIIKKTSYNHWTYEKIAARKAQAIAKLSIACFANIQDGKIETFRCAFGAVGPVVLRSKESEALITGLSVEEAKEKLDALSKAYGFIISPIDDQRSTADYRSKVCLGLLKAFIMNL